MKKSRAPVAELFQRSSATRKASEEEALLANALTPCRCADRRRRHGARDQVRLRSRHRDTELKMLRVARQIAKERPVTVKTSFLGAHAVPPDYRDRADAYLDEVCLPTLEAAHAEGLVDAVDGFCEGIAFSPEQMKKVFDKARDAWPSGQAACRAAFQSRWHELACGVIQCAFRRSPGISRRGRC